jgi:anti-anti-sigma regulatory factor
MESYRVIKVERHGESLGIRLRRPRLDESEIQCFGEEAIAAAAACGHRAALSLGPKAPDCLYSVFLSKLVSIRNALRREGGDLVLVEAGPAVRSVFEACLLHREFTFLPDFAAAEAHFASLAQAGAEKG